ncbi:MAG: DUF4886 domain-containing protein [Ruminococcaceae bacterium]|nr:DUF4886 domain-containing protein [Oscillospiraceae bacterium]
MKKFLFITVTVLSLLVLSACGDTPADDSVQDNFLQDYESTAPVVTTVPETTAHVHEYTETVETPAKTFTEGVKKLSCSSCGDAYTEVIPATKSIKILAIGNSFSVDAMQYLWNILKDGGVEKITLGNLYIGGCSLEKHANNIASGAGAYTYYKNISGSWTTTSNTAVLTALKQEDWDIVTVQQASNYSGMASTYSYLSSILSFVEKNEPNAEIYWHMTWAYQQDSTHSGFKNYSNDQMTMYNSILKAVETEVKTKESICGVIPSGTAIQNLRTSYIGDTVTRDGYHLSYDFGRYTAALTWFAYFTGKSPDSVDWMPADHAVNLRPHLPAIREAVKNAIAAPDKVTAVKAEDPNVNAPQTDAEWIAAMGKKAEDYVKLDWMLEVQAYYNSSSSSNLTSKANSSASNLPNFIASKQFTKKELPVGSIIIVDAGYQYRPEGWTDLNAKTSPRPGNVSGHCVEATEDWWGNYTVRAFNLSASPNRAMTAEDAEHLRIYVPKN